MKLYIEVLVFIAFILVLIGWASWYRLTNYINKRRYKPENDRGKKAEDSRKAELERIASELAARELRSKEPDSRIEEPTNSTGQFGSDEERSDVPTPATEPTPENSNGVGKPKFSFRNPFRRRK